MKKRARRSSTPAVKQEKEGNKSMAVKRERGAAGKAKDSISKNVVKQPLDAAGEGGDAKTNRFRAVRTRSSEKFAAVFGGKNRCCAAEEAAHAYDCAAVSLLGPKAITNSPLSPISSSPNPNLSPVPQPLLQEQGRILRPRNRTPAASTNISSVESISEHKPPPWEQLNFLRKVKLATPKARNRTSMAQSSVPEPTAIIEEHCDENPKKKKSKLHSNCHSLPETSSQQRSASIEVMVDARVGALTEGSSDANIMHPSDHYCRDLSLEMVDGACDARVVTELNEGSVLSDDKTLMQNLPDEILRDQFQSALANVSCVLMQVLRRFKESNLKLQRISKENEELALHNNALVATTTLLGKHSKVQATKLKTLEAELELCRSELSQSKTDLEQTEIELEIELGAAKHEVAEIEAHHQAVLNEVKAKHKAALSEAAETAVKEFKKSKACEDDLVALVAPAYGMGFTEALDLAKKSGASVDLSQEAFARTYQPGSKVELMRRVALFKEGKDLSEFYEFAGPAEGEQVMPECSGQSQIVLRL